MSSLFKNNVLSFIDNQLKKETQLPDKRKIQNFNHYCKTLGKAESKWLKSNDFSLILEGIFPEELLVFDEQQRKELDGFSCWISSPEEYSCYMQILAKAIDDFRNSEDIENPIFKAILNTYNYMLQKLNKKYPLIYQKYLKAKGQSIAKVEEKQSRPPCPECNGNHIMSSGINWICRDCGRNFAKYPRKKGRK